MFDTTELINWLTFVGYGRSGHSFIGSALDAHPHACIAHEANAIDRWVDFQDRENFFRDLFERNRLHVQGGRLTDNRWGEPYQQYIEGQLKKSGCQLRLMGNKNGSVDTGFDIDKFSRKIELFDRFLGPKISHKFVFVQRNPYDAGLLRREPYDVLQQICTRYADRLYRFRYEDFIANPRGVFSRLLSFLGLDSTTHYLDRVVAATSPALHKARYKIEYTRKEIEHIQASIDANDVFSGYTYYS